MTIPRSHRLDPWYGQWHPMLKKWQKRNPNLWNRGMATDIKKNPVRKTEVWSLPDRVKNLNAGVCHPSKLPLIDRRRMPANCCLPDRRKYDDAKRKGANLVFFPRCRLTSDVEVKKKNRIRALLVHTILFAEIQKATILTLASVVHQ